MKIDTTEALKTLMSAIHPINIDEIRLLEEVVQDELSEHKSIECVQFLLEVKKRLSQMKQDMMSEIVSNFIYETFKDDNKSV